MKKVLCGLMFSCWSMFAYANNSVVVSAADGAPGDTVTVQIVLSASDRVVAAEFSVPIADGITYIEESFNALTSDMSSSCVFVDDELRVYFYCADLDYSQLGNGDIFSFKVRLGSNPIIAKIQPKVILSDLNGKSLDVTVKSASITVKAPQIRFSSEVVDFGHIAIRSTYSKDFEITNTGTIPLNVSSITCSSNELTVSDASFIVDAGETKQLTLIYSPIYTGACEMVMTIESDAVDNVICFVTVVSDAYSVNILKVDNSIGDADSIVSVDLYMDNMEDIYALQCSVVLPEGITYVNGSFIASDRLETMIYFSTVVNNRLNFYVYSESEGLIKEGSGKVASFKLYLGTANGKYDLVPEGVILCNKEQVNVVSGTENGSVEILSPLIYCSSAHDMGTAYLPETAKVAFPIFNDGNKDLIIDKIVFDNNLFCLNEDCPLIVKAGGKKDIEISCNSNKSGDFTSTMSIYTNVPGKRVVDVNIKSRIIEPNYITSVVRIDQSRMSGSLCVSMSNYNKITAAQMNLYGLEKIMVDESSLVLSERCEGLSYVLSQNDDGSVRVLIYSMGNESITGNSGEVFTLNFLLSSELDVDALISLSGIIISDEFGNDISSSDVNISTILSEVDQIQKDYKVLEKYDLTGKRIETNDISNLPFGIYIKNGRKYIVR